VNLFPIVNRELLAGARRKGTYRIRWWTALLGMGMSFCSLFFLLMGSGRAGLGSLLFQFLTGYAFGLCLLAGVFLTSDCLSEEKREGTLGMLLLTDLNSHDVVFGKFVGKSLNAFYGLVGLLPVTAIPLLLGGVTGGEFWRMALALVNVLFLSLAAGTMVSALARDAQRAMGSTVVLLGFLTIGLPALAGLISLAGLPATWSSLTWINPVHSFVFALESRYGSQPQRYWISVLSAQLLAWIFLGLASVILPRSWQEKALVGKADSACARFIRRGRGSAAHRSQRRRMLLPTNPVAWLLGEEPSFRSLVWAIVAGWGVVVFVAPSLLPQSPLNLYQIAKVCGFLLKTLIAFQACRFFADSRRNGALELLLCTPLRNREIIRGQWQALRGIFLMPLLVFMLLNLVPIYFYVRSAMSGPSAAQVWNAALGFGGGFTVLGWFTIIFVMDFLAVGWLGMWLALSMKKPHLAAGMTILVVLILPSVPFCPLDLLADFIIIIWASTKLQTDFRWVLARQHQSQFVRRNPPSSAPRPAPPIISRQQ
jgi:ABC-type transport system involved in multi-copper enzyme maturation permease subunit